MADKNGQHPCADPSCPGVLCGPGGALDYPGEQVAENDYIAEWREQLGIEVMHLMRCTHVGSDFGPRAVCETCFDNTQRIGVLVQHLAAVAWDRGRAAERRDWEFTADLSTPDEDRQPLLNPYREGA